MFCDRYACRHCGPRRVALWRDLAEHAAPERFITLSRVADDLVGARRVVTTIMQRLRRAGYRMEYLVTFERHKNGTFHAHLLQKGDYIPQAVLSEALRSATHGRSFVCDIRRADGKVAGYVTKYITKQLTGEESGRRPDGTAYRPHRVSTSRRFFPAPVALLKEYVRAEAADRRAERLQEEHFDYEGSWQMVETEPYDRRDREGQQARLAAARVDEVGTEVRRARGELLVLRYMLGEV